MFLLALPDSPFIRVDVNVQLMERVCGCGVVPVAAGAVGLLILLKLVQRFRNKKSLQNKVVVITGASSGLGKECARAFYAAGARLILCGRDPKRLRGVVEELRSRSPGETPTHTPCIATFDLSSASVVPSAAQEILKFHGHVDVLINNAGVSYRGNVLDTHMSVQRDVMETNYFGPIALTQALLPSMVSRRSGHVVAISSVQGKISIPYRSAYAVSKHAMQAYFDCLRAEVAEFGLEVSVLSPGYIRTNLSLNAVRGDGSQHGVMDHSIATGMDPAGVAAAVLEAVSSGQEDVVVAGFLPSAAIYLRTLWPSLYFRVMVRRAARERQGKED